MLVRGSLCLLPPTSQSLSVDQRLRVPHIFDPAGDTGFSIVLSANLLVLVESSDSSVEIDLFDGCDPVSVADREYDVDNHDNRESD
jgi:hypothetical protein